MKSAQQNMPLLLQFHRIEDDIPEPNELEPCQHQEIFPSNQYDQYKCCLDQE